MRITTSIRRWESRAWQRQQAPLASPIETRREISRLEIWGPDRWLASQTYNDSSMCQRLKSRVKLSSSKRWLILRRDQLSNQRHSIRIWSFKELTSTSKNKYRGNSLRWMKTCASSSSHRQWGSKVSQQSNLRIRTRIRPARVPYLKRLRASWGTRLCRWVTICQARTWRINDGQIH